MLTESELKQQLQPLAGDEFATPATAALAPLVEAVTAHIGSIDSELRDDLIYSAFATWVIDGVLSEAQLRVLLTTILDEQHLFFRMGESDEDAVFTRSFAVLLLPTLLVAHRQRPFLTPEEFQATKQQVLRYASLETDRRGFVEGKGWAHSAAHTADALTNLARSVELEAADLTEILHAIKTVAALSEQVYTHEEDERLSIAVVSGVLYRHLLGAAEWDNWLNDCVAIVEEPRPMLQSLYCRTNIKNLLRSTYFRLNRLSETEEVRQGETAELADRITRTINQLTRF